MRVGEINVRLDGDRLPPPDRTGQRWLHQLVVRREESSRVAGQLFLSRTFVLSLVNDEFIAVRVVNFDEGLIDRMRENPWSMLELALDAAGLTGALDILEAGAGRRKGWVSREGRRRGPAGEDHPEGGGLVRG